MIVILSGLSGTGKSTLARWLEMNGNFIEAVSHTTRPQRGGEIDGVHYYFVSEEEFNQMLEDGKFIEFVELYGYKYGLTYDEIERIHALGKDAVVVLHPEGLRYFDKVCKQYGCLRVMLHTDAIEVLRYRMVVRGDDPDVIEKRLAEVDGYERWFKYYDMVLDAMEEVEKNGEIIKGAI
jgi:guanylate kinase